MTFYTSDWHLGHANIIKSCSRPFSSVEEMNETIIANYNARVGKNDDVYVLGDIMLKILPEPEKIIRRFNGRKHLIIGNHDYPLLKKTEAMAEFESVDYYLRHSDNGRTVILCHYPILEWDGYYHGSYHVFGHIHNDTSSTQKIMASRERAFNAGVDVNAFFPVTLNELIEGRLSNA